jgi:hypothetical protein
MYDIVRKQPALATHRWKHGYSAIWRSICSSAAGRISSAQKLAQTRNFKPVQLQGVTLTASYAVDAQTIVSKNVAGRVVGSTHPEQTVIYSAHWDHLGVGLPDAKGDKIYNGASTTPPASPRCWNWRAPMARRRRHSAACCSSL